MTARRRPRRRANAAPNSAPEAIPEAPAPPSEAPQSYTYAQWVLPLVTLAALANAWRLRWVAEDAWISLRYARNLVDGHGLVFNVGERVEGYTNFLWTILLAVGLAVGAPPQPLVVALGLACTVAAMAALGVLWRRVVGPRALVPAALCAVAVNYSYASFCTSGLEGSLLGALLAAAFALAPLDENLDAPALRRRAALTGLALTLAVMTRPDAALALVALGAALAVDPSAARHRAGALAAFVAPVAALYLPYFALRWSYYGSPLPNTYYAKSADGPLWSQGFAYVSQFAGRYFLAPMAAVLIVRAIVGLARAEQRSVRVGAIAGYVALHVLYVASVGGDFMEGRFLVTVLPLFFLLVEASVRTFNEGAATTSTALVAMVFASALNAQALAPGAIVAGIADERSWAPMFDLWKRDGEVLARHLPAGTVLATDSVGAFGWGADGFAIVDTLGLTDAYVARTERALDRRAGHQHLAPLTYLQSRRVAILRDGLNLYRFPRAPDWVSATHRYFLLTDDPAVRAGFFAAVGDAGR